MKEKVSSGEIPLNDTEAVVEGLISLVSEHLSSGDKIAIQEFSIRSRHSVSRRSKSSEKSSYKGHESKFFVVREFMLILHDWRYLGRKIWHYSRKLATVTAVITAYYFLTILIGC